MKFTSFDSIYTKKVHVEPSPLIVGEGSSS